MLASASFLGRTTPVVAVAVLTFGCERPAAPLRTAPRKPAVSTESAYHPPPSVMRAAFGHENSVTVEGRAQPLTSVRLRSPEGRSATAQADRNGVWRVTLPATPGARFLSVSTIDGGRAVQSEGYLVLTPETAAVLRSGAGAWPLSGAPSRARLVALDYDRKGGAVVTALGAPGGILALSIDGARRAAGRAGADGRLVIALEEPLTPGVHQLQLTGGVAKDDRAAEVSPAGLLPAVPLRATREAADWRIDWMTPAGGVQTTLLFVGAS